MRSGVTVEPELRSPPDPLLQSRIRRVLLVALGLNQFAVAAACGSVATVGQGLRVAVGLPATGLPWAVIVYVLALGGLLLPLRWLCTRIGPFLTLLAGLWMFVQSSAVIGAGLVTTPTAFLVLRGVQGAGAGALTAVTLALLERVFPLPGEREGAQFGWSGVVLAGLTVGMVLGGAVPEDGWRWAFWINLPLGVLSGMTTLRLLRIARRVDRGAARHQPEPA